ncbi:hypothetical protein SAMN04487983_1009172 [Streptomyces sp. yr375]|uniref:hypothetical protein n=1 Tax=Streptomyces sp. yr375 TaxID=1761906 RepID=UPI0008D0227C|nr:hypothetical protein [Streptomyces sp. yr375]SEQ94059.1 hypothetical protein SAMN04487983_1009172 [Streptomyces sp. yr375]
MPLTANAPVLVVSRVTAPAIIHWDYPFDVFLYESQRNINQPDAYSRMLILSGRKGKYTKDLAPGSVYTVLALDHVADANEAPHVMEREAIDKVTVLAVRGMASLITDTSERVGGTFYRNKVATSVNTHALLQIGLPGSIVIGGAGFKFFPNPLLTVPSFVSLLHHQLTTDKITDMDQRARLDALTLGGTALITVMDVDGKWEQRELPYQLLLQKLTIHFETVDPQGLGNMPWFESSADIRFRFEVWDYIKHTKSLLKAWVFFNQNTTLTPFNVSDFVFDAEWMVGPRLANVGTASLLLSVRQFDDPPFEDEFATSLHKFVEVQPGEYTEADPLTLVVRAAQEPDPLDPENELDIDAYVTVDVEYIRP